jgi:hypothetical protein
LGFERMYMPAGMQHALVQTAKCSAVVDGVVAVTEGPAQPTAAIAPQFRAHHIH